MKRLVVTLAVCSILCGCAAKSTPEVIVTKGENIATPQVNTSGDIIEDVINEEDNTPADKTGAIMNNDDSKLLLGSGWSTIDIIRDADLTANKGTEEIEEIPEQEPVQEIEEPTEEVVKESTIPLKKKNIWNPNHVSDEWNIILREIHDNGEIEMCENITEVSTDCIDDSSWLNSYFVNKAYDWLHNYKESDDTKYSWKDIIPDTKEDLLNVLGLEKRDNSNSIYEEYLPTLICNTNIWVVDQNEYFGDNKDYEVSFESREGFYHEDEEYELPHLWFTKNSCNIIKIGDYYYYVALYLNGTSSMDINGYVKYTKGDESRYMLIDLESLARKCSEYVSINYNGSIVGYMISADYISAETIKQIIDEE